MTQTELNRTLKRETVYGLPRTNAHRPELIGLAGNSAEYHLRYMRLLRLRAKAERIRNDTP
jgi:hypothetical protein